jgi:RNA polymerase sigma factor (sigma-70 family)
MDGDLVRLAMRGDAEAFERLGRPRFDHLFAIAYRILRNHHDAEDAVQQALWEAWRDLPALRDVDRFDAWLQRLLVNGCYRQVRNQRARHATIVLLPEHDRPIPGETSRIGDRDELDRAFGALTAEHRAVVVLHHYLGLALVEVARTLEIPEGTARSRLHHAHRRLRELLDQGRSLPAAGAGR